MPYIIRRLILHTLHRYILYRNILYILHLYTIILILHIIHIILHITLIYFLMSLLYLFNLNLHLSINRQLYLPKLFLLILSTRLLLITNLDHTDRILNILNLNTQHLKLIISKTNLITQ